MKIKTQLLLVLIFFSGIIGSGFYFLVPPQLAHDKVASALPDNKFGWKYPSVKFPMTGPNDISYSDIRDPGGLPQGLPVRLKIPVIGVDSAIEDALITPDGRMDVPSGSVNVAWFALGPHPGQEGSAVIGGHFGINNGVKFVFYDLDKIKVGDKVYIEDDTGNTLAFQVRMIKLFNRDADATTVFTSHDGLAHLNIITCEGIWNQINGNYPERRVVFTDAITGEGSVTVNKTQVPAVVKPKSPAAVKPKLPPTAIAPTTDTAPALIDVVEEAPASPVDSTPAPLPEPPSLFVQSFKNLFATPLDMVITLVLLTSIIFVAFKIMRR